MTDQSRPHICDELGVDVGERFDAGPYKDAYVDCAGSVRTNIGTLMDADRVCDLINHPNRIVRKPHFTQAEVVRAKAIKVLFPEADEISVNIVSTKINAGCKVLCRVDRVNWFPGIRENHSAALDDIIRSEEFSQ